MGPFPLAAVETLHVAQATQATLVGSVRDASTAAPIAGAVVALPDLERAVATDADGRYVLRQVSEGRHPIAVRFIGYAPCTLQALSPPEGRLEINIWLRPEPVRIPTVDVRAPVAVRGLDGGDPGGPSDRETSIAAARNHPLLAEPDAFQALGGGEVVLRPESPSGVHIRGGAADQTAYLLDGIPVFSPYHAAGVSSGWNPDALSRMTLSGSAPSPAAPHTLSGSIEATTRTPGARLHSQGSVSTAQARFAFDGPLGVAGASYLVGWRSGLPDIFAPADEGSYVRGETGDVLAKVEAPALGGRIRLLGYSSEDDLSAAAAVPVDGSSEAIPRNLYEWTSRSVGAEWARGYSDATVRVLLWSAASDANSRWIPATAPLDMVAARRDEGLLASVEHGWNDRVTSAGIRAEQIKTSYRVVPDSSGASGWRLGATTPVATAFAQQSRAVGRRTRLGFGASLLATGGKLHLAPRAQVRWSASDDLILTGTYARTYQPAQSLRNPESVVGNVFPVELYVSVGTPGVPVARSDQGVIAVEYRPSAGVRLGAQAYARASDGLLLVAPREGGPFATGAFEVGSGTARGFSIDAGVSAARYGIVASYGYQQVQLEYGTSRYVPESGAAHLLEGGVIASPITDGSIRLGAVYAVGRRATSIANGFEWEAHNLIDRGSEFAGSPDTGGEPLGAAQLPAYFRVDLGIRKQWHVGVGGREGTFALFGTVTNLLGRYNVLTYASDPASGEPVGVEMRPRAPLVLGLDWQF